MRSLICRVLRQTVNMPDLFAWLQENLFFFSEDFGIALVTSLCRQSHSDPTISLLEWQGIIETASQVSRTKVL